VITARSPRPPGYTASDSAATPANSSARGCRRGHKVRRIDEDASIPVVEMGVLRNMEIFPALPGASRETLAREASYETAHSGTTIISEGDAGNSYYAITVDVMAADLLQLQHHRSEPLGRRLPTLDLPRDVEVLAKDAAQVAVGEEDRARAVPAAQAVLLAEVRKVGGRPSRGGRSGRVRARPRGGPQNTAWDKLCTAHPATGAHAPRAATKSSLIDSPP
jgi:hypothetical protein